jgi:hypothetical protein
MVKKSNLEIGGHCFVRRPEGSFAGRVAELREGWGRIVGKGSIADTTFDEWFPIESKLQSINPA